MPHITAVYWSNALNTYFKEVTMTQTDAGFKTTGDASIGGKNLVSTLTTVQKGDKVYVVVKPDGTTELTTTAPTEGTTVKKVA